MTYTQGKAWQHAKARLEELRTEVETSPIVYWLCPSCGTEVSQLWEIGENQGVCAECAAESFGVQVEKVEYVTHSLWNGRSQ